MSLTDALDEYLTACKTEGKSAKTLLDYRQKITRFIKWRDGGTIAELTLPIGRAFVVHLQETHKWSSHATIATSERTLAAQSVVTYVRTLKGFSTWLFEEGYLPENTLKRLVKPKVPTRVVEVLAPEEVMRVLDCIDSRTGVGARDAGIMTLFLDSGLRLSELVGLRVADVHLQQGWLKVCGKGDKERLVPFGSQATKTLTRYLTHFRPAELTTDRLFVNIDGKPITANSIKMLFTRLRQRSGVERIHPHLMRHTFATNYLIAGGDVFSLQSILGHSTLDMTRRYVTLAGTHVALQHRRFSPVDLLSGDAAGAGSLPRRPASGDAHSCG